MADNTVFNRISQIKPLPVICYMFYNAVAVNFVHKSFRRYFFTYCAFALVAERRMSKVVRQPYCIGKFFVKLPIAGSV